jgi:hypothetical protein
MMIMELIVTLVLMQQVKRLFNLIVEPKIIIGLRVLGLNVSSLTHINDQGSTRLKHRTYS